MKISLRSIPIFLWILLISCSAYCQLEQTEFKIPTDFYDSIIGLPNTGLYKGLVYGEKYRTINEKTQFFIQDMFFDGAVFYDNQLYKNLNLKYDIFRDKVLLKTDLASHKGLTLELLNDYLDFFEIDGRKFVRLPFKNSGEIDQPGFYEESVSNSYFAFYTKHRKEKIDRTDRALIYQEFSKVRSVSVLYYNGMYYPINSKRDITLVFPDLKKEISEFYVLARSLQRKDKDSFLISLMKRIELLLSRSENQ